MSSAIVGALAGAALGALCGLLARAALTAWRSRRAAPEHLESYPED